MAAASPISDEALSAAASAPAVLEEIRDRAKALVQEDVVTKLRQGIPKLTSSLLETLERHEASPKLQEELWAALQPFQGSCLSSLGKLEDFAKSTLENLTRNVSISDLNLAARTLYQVLRKPPSPAASPTGSRAAPGSTAGGPAPTAPPKAARPAVPQPIASAPPAVPLRDHAAAWKPSTPAAAPAADAGGRERAAKRPRGDPDGSVAATASTRISAHASFSSQPRATAPAAAPKMPAAASHPPAATLPALPPAAAAVPAAVAKPHQAPVPVAPHPQPPQQQQPRPAAAASSPQVPTLTAAMLAGSPSPPGAANRTAQPAAQAKLLLRSAAAPAASAVPVATGPAIPGAGHATALLRLLQQQQQQQQQQGQPTAAAANVGRFVNLMQGKAIATSKPSLPAPTVMPPGTVPMRVAAHAAAGRLPASAPMPALVGGAPPAAYARATAAAPAPSPAAAKPAAHGPPAARQASPAVAAAQPQPAAGQAAAAAPAPAAAPAAAPASASASAGGKQEDAAKGAETKLVALSWTATQDYLERLGHQVALGREVYGLVRPAQHGIPNPR